MRLAGRPLLRKGLKAAAALGYADPLCPDVLLQLDGDDDGRGMLVRCYDTGATRGMTRLSDVAKGNLEEGPELAIETGNGIVRTKWYERALLRSAPADSEAEEVVTKNVVMQDTSNTASIRDMNSSLGFGYMWQEPEEAGTCGATYLTRSAETGSHSILEPPHELWPLRVNVQTPERADDDETLVRTSPSALPNTFSHMSISENDRAVCFSGQGCCP